MTASDKFRLFLSYSCRDTDHPFLEQLRALFERPDMRQVATVFMAEDNPRYGNDFIAKVLDELRASDLVLPFITEASQVSPWVNQEIGYALARGIPVLPAFDPGSVKGLQGMIQTTDACPINNSVKVQALFDQVLALASKGSTTRKHGLFVDVKGIWWSMYNGAFPMYVRVHIRHIASESDAVERVHIECPGRIAELESIDLPKLRELKETAFENIVLKFFPNGPGCAATEQMRLVVQTVRGITAIGEFEANGPSGCRPAPMWEGFKPY